MTPHGRAAEVASQVARLARGVLGDRVRVLWFGSWPQGRAVHGSDIDIALESDGPIPPEVFARLRDAVEGLPTLHSVDLVDLRLADERLREEVLAHGVAL
jgi:predicted nucleotidyltransferase